MPNWKYKLESEGKLLRQLIEEEKEPEIIEHLQVCYKRLLSKLTPKDKENFLDDIEESYNLLDGEADVIRDTPDVVVNEWEFISTGGEGFKFYIEDCIEMNIKPTLEGFEKHIDNLNSGKSIR